MSGPSRRPTAPKRILVVEDEPGIRTVVGLLLERQGFPVQLAANGAEAIQLVRTFRPNVVLLDLGLPDIHGFDVAEAIRDGDASPDALIIVMTAFRQEDCTADLERLRVDHYMRKPVDWNRVWAILEQT